MTVFDEVIRRVRKESRVENSKIDGSSTLDELGLSSLQVADIIYSLVDDFEIEIDAELTAQINTVGDLVAIMDKALGEKGKHALVNARRT
jgi:acyl carrier protein